MSENKVIKFVSRQPKMHSSFKREPIKLVNKQNGRPQPVIQKAGVTKTRRIFSNGGKTN